MANPEKLFLQGTYGSLGHAVAFGLAHEGGRAGDAEAADLVPEVLRHVGRPMVMAQLQARGHAGLDAAEMPGDPLPDRLERLPAACAGGGLGADEFPGAVIDCDEDAGAALRGR